MTDTPDTPPPDHDSEPADRALGVDYDADGTATVVEATRHPDGTIELGETHRIPDPEVQAAIDDARQRIEDHLAQLGPGSLAEQIARDHDATVAPYLPPTDEPVGTARFRDSVLGAAVTRDTDTPILPEIVLGADGEPVGELVGRDVVPVTESRWLPRLPTPPVSAAAAVAAGISHATQAAVEHERAAARARQDFHEGQVWAATKVRDTERANLALAQRSERRWRYATATNVAAGIIGPGVAAIYGQSLGWYAAAAGLVAGTVTAHLVVFYGTWQATMDVVTAARGRLRTADARLRDAYAAAGRGR
jgi:hypothetical protein